MRESRTVDLEPGESTLRFEHVSVRLDAHTLAFDLPVHSNGRTALRHRLRVGR